MVAELRYAVRTVPDRWILPEGKVPESRPHDLASERFRDQLEAWVERTGRDAQVARNLAVRWDRARPRIGVDPDVCLIEPTPPERDDLTSLCAWKAGHSVPCFALEIVSIGHPYKDYAESPDKYAACGVEELAIFDPLLAGPLVGGGPHLLQSWQRDGSGAFARVYAGPGPARSAVLGAWLHVEGEKWLRVSDDEAGANQWLTREEAALRRVAELEAELVRLK
jgi:putative restriction endonuclease